MLATEAGYISISSRIAHTGLVADGTSIGSLIRSIHSPSGTISTFCGNAGGVTIVAALVLYAYHAGKGPKPAVNVTVSLVLKFQPADNFYIR